MRISDWSSDVGSSDLFARSSDRCDGRAHRCDDAQRDAPPRCSLWARDDVHRRRAGARGDLRALIAERRRLRRPQCPPPLRSEEHTSELQSLMRISYAVFCLKKKNQTYTKALEQCHNLIT